MNQEPVQHEDEVALRLYKDYNRKELNCHSVENVSFTKPRTLTVSFAFIFPCPSTVHPFIYSSTVYQASSAYQALQQVLEMVNKRNSEERNWLIGQKSTLQNECIKWSITESLICQIYQM